MTETLSVSEAKERLSEIVERVAGNGDRFVIESMGRPVAAVVSTEGLSDLEEETEQPEGLLGAVGAWSEMGDDEIDSMVEEIYRQRRESKGRPISFD